MCVSNNQLALIETCSWSSRGKMAINSKLDIIWSLTAKRMTIRKDAVPLVYECQANKGNYNPFLSGH